MTIILAISVIGFIGVITTIMIRGRRLMTHIKSRYINVYKGHFEQRGMMVDTITPNLFLLSSEAKAIAEQDILFKRLRRDYGLAWLLVPLWMVSILIIVVLLGRLIA
jgi:hypothetical protein